MPAPTKTVRGVIAELVEIEHKQAVYDMLLTHLEQYLPADADDEPQEALLAEGCVVPQVSDEALESVYDALVEERLLLEEAGDELMGRPVITGVEEEPKATDTDDDDDEE